MALTGRVVERSETGWVMTRNWELGTSPQITRIITNYLSNDWAHNESPL